MNNKLFKFGGGFLPLLILLISIGLVLPLTTAKQETQLSATALEIAYPKYDYVPQSQPFELKIHVINNTDQKTNLSTTCFIDLYNAMGEETAHSFLSYHPNGDWEVDISAGNFSMLGINAFYIQCNSSNEIGFANGVFEVTPSGSVDDLTTSSRTTLIFIFIVAGYLLLIFAFKTKEPMFGFFAGLLITACSLFVLSGSGSVGVLNMKGNLMVTVFIYANLAIGIVTLLKSAVESIKQ